MTEAERLTNYDLDVELALQGFPQNPKNAYLYVRAEKKKEEGIAYLSFSGTPDTLSLALLSAMEEEEVAEAVLSATLTFVSNDKKTIDRFVKLLKKL